MSRSWPLVALSDIAEPVSRSIPVQPGTPYRTIGVKWWGGGAYERETIDGAQTAAKTLSIIGGGGACHKPPQLACRFKNQKNWRYCATVPVVSKQKEAASIVSKHEVTKRLQTETAAELDAILP